LPGDAAQAQALPDYFLFQLAEATIAVIFTA
jgi:hypothetical protein